MVGPDRDHGRASEVYSGFFVAEEGTTFRGLGEVIAENGLRSLYASGLTRYPDFTAKHFHEKLVCEHGLRAELQLASPELAGARARSSRRPGAGAPPEAAAPTVVGMMLHQDGSSHEWLRASGGT